VNAPVKSRKVADRRAFPSLAPLARPLEKRRLQSYLGLMLGDILAVFTGFGIAGYLYLGPQGASNALVQAQLLLPIFVTIALYNGSYAMDVLMQAHLGVLRSWFALAIAAVALVFIAFYTKSSAEFSRVAFTVGVIFAAMLLSWSRLQLRSFVAWRCGATVINQLIIDDGGPPVTMPQALRVSARDLALAPDLADPHALDRIGLVLRHIDRVVVSCPPERRGAWAMIFKGANIAGEVLDDSVVQLGAQGAREAGGHGWLLVSTGPLGLRARAIKRLLDIVLAGGALLVLSPVLLLVALAILIEDGRPILFVQQRMGRGNRFFRIYKFRSMAKAQADGDGVISALREDDRVTRVGRYIRRTSIDELPQLANVLCGDMSLVGPRPHAIGSQAGDKLFWEVDTRYWSRHSLKPGLSGLAQIRGLRGATEQEEHLAERLRSDLEYLEGWTIWRDIHIIVLTLRVVMHDRAY
jgi:polysaccharide biosynthesis protein PslA